MKKKLNIKIYGVTTIGAKGQIILPKEARVDMNIEKLTENLLILIEKSVLGLCKNNDCIEDIKKDKKEFEIIGNVKIGTKFQFVIPCDIRKKLSIKTGDNLVVIGELGKGLGFLKNDDLDMLFEHLKFKLN